MSVDSTGWSPFKPHLNILHTPISSRPKTSINENAGLVSKPHKRKRENFTIVDKYGTESKEGEHTDDVLKGAAIKAQGLKNNKANIIPSPPMATSP